MPPVVHAVIARAWRDRIRVRVYYDGLCGICRASMARLKLFDWLNALEPVSFHSEGVVARDGLDLARLNRRLQARLAAGGPIHEGIDAVVQIAWRVPILWPIAPLLLLAGRLGIGQRAYDFVAARRHRLGRARG
jgi:predicted DCC family thiol-disulfide oxidoreductase YuxK